MKGPMSGRSGQRVGLTEGGFPGATCLHLPGQGLGPLRHQVSGLALDSGSGVQENGKHTDLLLMAKQLGDQGGLSKNLQEREGEGYGETKAGEWGSVLRLGYKKTSGWLV